jgi:hypothetical protein
MMASILDQSISRKLRAVLADLPIGAGIAECAQLRDVLSEIGWFLPEVLVDIYPEWKDGKMKAESLDGIIRLVARKTNDTEAEIFGLCIFVSDQCVTPFDLRLQLGVANDEISWLECRLGEQGERGMVRTPYESLNTAAKRLHALEWRADLIDWVYKVTFGVRRP